MGISKFQLQLLQKIPREPKSPLTTNELADSLYNANEKGVSRESLRKRIINNINQLEKVFPDALLIDKSEKDHRYRLSAKAPLLLTPMSQEEMIAFGILSHFGTDLLPDRTLEALNPYFEEAKEAAFHWARETGHGVRASKELAGNWLKKIAVVPAVMPFTAPEVNQEIKRIVHEALFYEELLKLKFINIETGKPETCIASPLALVQQGVRTYVIVKKQTSKKAERILLARILEAGVTIGNIEHPKNWNLSKFLEQGISHAVFPTEMYGKTHDFKFWVDASTQWLKETKLGENQTTSDNPDGSYILHVTLPLTEELVRWVQSMTVHVKAMEPDFLVKRLKDDLKKTLAIYK